MPHDLSLLTIQAVLAGKNSVLLFEPGCLNPEEAAAVSAHGLGGACLRRVADRDAMSQEVFSVLQRRTRADVALRLLAEDGLREAGEAFVAEGIRATAVGGMGRSGQAYLSSDDRPVTDIDLFVSQDDSAPLSRVMASLGYEERTPMPAANYVRGALTVDIAATPWLGIHLTRIAGEEATFPGLCGSWREQAEPGPIPGIDILSLPAEFFFQALHYAYKHSFSRHLWGLDLLLLAREMTSSDWATLLTLAEGGQGVIVLAHVFDQLAHLNPGWSSPVAFPADPSYLRRRLFRRAGRGQVTYGFGYLLALALSPSVRFRYHLVGRLLMPPPPHRAPGFCGALRHLASVAKRIV